MATLSERTSAMNRSNPRASVADAILFASSERADPQMMVRQHDPLFKVGRVSGRFGHGHQPAQRVRENDELPRANSFRH